MADTPETRPTQPQEAPTQTNDRLPETPPSIGKTVLFSAGIGAVAGAALQASWNAARAWASGTKAKLNWKGMGNMALNVGIISGAMGYVRGQDNVVLHSVAKENEKLVDTVNTLQEEKAALQKSFVTFVKESKAAAEPGQQHTR